MSAFSDKVSARGEKGWRLRSLGVGLLDRRMRRVLLAVVAVRLVQLARGESERFVAAGRDLESVYYALTSVYVALFVLVPLFAYALSGHLEALLNPERVVRHRSRMAVASRFLREAAPRVLAMALAVATGDVALMAGTSAGTGAELVALWAEAVSREVAFFLACAAVMLAVFSLARSVAYALVAALVYTAVDLVVSLSVDPAGSLGVAALGIGWFRASPASGGGPVGLARDLAVLAGVAALSWGVAVARLRRLDVAGAVSVGAAARGSAGEKPHRLRWLPVRRRYPVRLALAVGVVGVVSLCLFRGDPGRALRQLLAGAAFVPGKVGSVFYLLGYAVVQVAFCALFADYLTSGLAGEGQLVFPRVGSRMEWCVVRLGQLALFSLCYGVLAPVVTVAVAAVGSGVGVGNVVPALALSCGWLALTTFVLSLAAALLSLWADALAAAVAVCGVHLATLAACAFAPEELVGALGPWLPSANAVLAFHDVGEAGVAALVGEGLAGFSLAWSVVYLLLVAALLAGLAVWSVRKRDVL